MIDMKLEDEIINSNQKLKRQLCNRYYDYYLYNQIVDPTDFYKKVGIDVNQILDAGEVKVKIDKNLYIVYKQKVVTDKKDIDHYGMVKFEVFVYTTTYEVNRKYKHDPCFWCYMPQNLVIKY